MRECAWIKIGTSEACGKRCRGTYCAIHNAVISRGGGLWICQGCGVAVKTPRKLCKPCGATTVYNQYYHKKRYAFQKEARRLSRIIFT